MTHDGGAELGTKVPLKNTPHLAEKGHPSPPQKVTTLLSSLPTINTLINPEEDAKRPPSRWTPWGGSLPTLLRTRPHMSKQQVPRG